MCGFLRRSVAAGTGPYVLEMYGDAPYFCVVQEAYAWGEHGLALMVYFAELDPRFGRIHNDPHQERWVAKRWDKKSKVCKPIGCPEAWQIALDFLYADPQPPADVLCEKKEKHQKKKPEKKDKKQKRSNDDKSETTGSVSKSEGAPACDSSKAGCVLHGSPVSMGSLALADPEPCTDSVVHPSPMHAHVPPGATQDLLALSQWMGKPGTFQGLFGVLVVAAVRRIKINVVMAGNVMGDILGQLCPKLLLRRGGFALPDHEMFIAPCITYKDGDSKCTRAPTNDLELSRCNHYTPLTKDYAKSRLVRAHSPCGGRVCGGLGFPCISQLSVSMSKLGFAIWPVPGDGDCMFHSVLWGLGIQHLGPIGAQQRLLLRTQCAEFLQSHVNDRELQQACVSLGEQDVSVAVAMFNSLKEDKIKAEPTAFPINEVVATDAKDTAAEPSNSSGVDISAPIASQSQQSYVAAGGLCQMLPEQQDLRARVINLAGLSGKPSNINLADRILDRLSTDERTALLKTDIPLGAKPSASSSGLRPGGSSSGGHESSQDYVESSSIVLRIGEPSGGEPPPSAGTAGKQTNQAKKRARRRSEWEIGQKISLAQEYLCWRGSQDKGKHYKQSVWGCQLFHKEKYGVYAGQSDRKFLKSCLDLLTKEEAGRLIEKKRGKRSHGCGRHRKCQPLREALFEWFCSVRKVVNGRFPLSMLRDRALQLRDDIVEDACRSFTVLKVPVINHYWIHAWRKQYRVSLRRPGKKFKVPRHVFLERCRITWCNVIRARLFVWHLFGYWPEIDGFDQTPFHFSESGSKEKYTLEHTSVKEVGLRENHQATRARWSASTWTSSDASDIQPLECMFKGGPQVCDKLKQALQRLRDGEPGVWDNCSVDTSASGSYKVEQVLTFLDRHMKPWSENRRWRILLADAARPHLSPRIREFCFQRKYLLVYIGGGTTCTMQVNDTHLHLPLSKIYQDTEMRWLASEMQEVPSRLPSVKREQCMEFLMHGYRRCELHANAAQGYSDLMYTLPIDGSQDHLARSSSFKIWHTVDMNYLRTQICADMKDECGSKRMKATLRYFEDLMEEFPKTGHLDEMEDGQQDEYDPDDEVPWDDDAAVLSTDEEEELHDLCEDQAFAMAKPENEETPATKKPRQCTVKPSSPVIKDNIDESDLDPKQQEHLSKMRSKIERIDEMIVHATGVCDHKTLLSMHKARALYRKQLLVSQPEDGQVELVLKKSLLYEDSELQKQQQRRAKVRLEQAAIRDCKKQLEEQHKDILRRREILNEKNRKRQLEEDCHNAAMAFDTMDFMPGEKGVGEQKAFSNRYSAFRRLLLIAQISPERSKTIAQDFKQWDNSIRSAHAGDNHYVKRFINMLTTLLNHNRKEEFSEIRTWWDKQLAKVVGKAQFVIPALTPDSNQDKEEKCI